MSAGLKINHPDGTSFIFNENSCPAYIVWSGNFNMIPQGEFVVPRRIPEGYEFCVISNQLGQLTYRVSGSQWEVAGSEMLSTWLNADRNPVLTWGGRVFPECYLHIIAWPTPAVSTGRYGLKVQGGNSIFASLNDTSILSYLLYKGEVDIYRGWKPNHIRADFNIDNVSCFFYTEDSDKIIKYENTATWNPATEWGKADYVYNVYSRSSNWDSSVRAKVCVFGPLNMQQATANKRYGLRIRNRNGEITFNDGIGILANPKAVYLPDKGIDVPFSIDGIRRPMYMPCGVGSGYADRTRYRFGINTLGSMVQVTRNEAIWYEASHGGLSNFVSPYPMLFIDAADYFNF
jgi:hypothetical protein